MTLKLYENEEKIPANYHKFFENIEKLTLEKRVGEICNYFVEYQKNVLQVNGKEDPFLAALQRYYEKCLEILNRASL